MKDKMADAKCSKLEMPVNEIDKIEEMRDGNGQI